MRYLCLDFETFSEADLTAVGGYEYSLHPSTEIICAAWSFLDSDKYYAWGFLPQNGQPYKQKENYIAKVKDVTDTTGIVTYKEIERSRTVSYKRYSVGSFGWNRLWEMFEQVQRDDVRISAFNSVFERNIWENVGVKKYGFPSLEKFGLEKFYCTMARGRLHSLPGSLGKTAQALGLDNLKDEAGKGNMMKISQPRKPSKTDLNERDLSPDKWKNTIKYCVNDVKVEKEISKTLRRFDDIGPGEHELWLLDQKINQRGIRLDRETILKAIDIVDEADVHLNAELHKITQDESWQLSQRDHLITWFSENGLQVTSLAKDNVENYLQHSDLEPDVRKVLELKKEHSKASVKKYYAMDRLSASDGYARNGMIYCGAGKTGRWSAMGIQFQNLARGSALESAKGSVFSKMPKEDQIGIMISSLRTGSYEKVENMYGNPLEVASTMLRSMVVADPGKKLYFSDYSSIESRILAWLAGEQSVLDTYISGDCLYKEMAGAIYGVADPQSLGKKSKERTVGKVAILGLGFGCGAKSLQTFAESTYGVSLDLSECEDIVKAYRTKYSTIKNYWYKTGDAAIAAIRNPGEVFYCGKVSYYRRRDGGALYCLLPSGRKLVYFNPSIQRERKPWGMVDQIYYYGLHPISKQWMKLSTYGASLVESQCQAFSRDIMAKAMLRLEAAGHSVCMSVHDEIVGNTDPSTTPNEIEEIMCEPLDFYEGLPLAAECEIAQRYRK
jgi:DNA polymerase